MRNGDAQFPQEPGEPALAEDEALDRLLSAARWPELSDAAMARLRDRVTSIPATASETAAVPKNAAREDRQGQPLFGMPRRRSAAAARWWVAGGAIAAAVAIAVYITRPQRQMGPPAESVAMAPSPRAPIAPPYPAVSPPELRVVSRPANVYERLIIASATSARGKTSAPAASADRIAEQLDSLLTAIAHGSIGPPAAAAQTSESMGADRARGALLWRLGHVSVDRRVPIVSLYGQLATARELPVLMHLADEGTLRPAALPALLRVADAATLKSLASRYPDEPSRSLVYQAMLARNDPRLTAAFLAAVQNPQTRSAALAGLRRTANPPVQQLIASLDSRRVDERIAAARALGALCHHGGTMGLLEQMVDLDVHRREALVALLSCTDPSARRYLEDARRRLPELAAQISAVRTDVSSAL